MLTYLCLTHSLLLALRFCFLPHFVLCLIAWYYILQYDLHFFVYTLLWWNPSDWFLFCHVCFGINSYKNTRGFPRPPLLTPDEGPSLETSIFALSFQVVREPLPFAYHWIHYLHWHVSSKLVLIKQFFIRHSILGGFPHYYN